jgi:hypothetical protein
MAQQVHDVSGRSCKLCGHTFTVSSMNLTLSVKQNGFIEKIRVCGSCHSKHMARGEI